MPIYEYKVIEKNGKEKKGSVEAPNEEAAAALAKAEGQLLISIKEQDIFHKEIHLSFLKAVSPRELSVFCRQFQSILAAGVTIISALTMLAEQTENKAFRQSLQEVVAAVEKGESLASAMGLQPRIFPPLFVSMVEAGEASGSLEKTFSRMGDYFEKESHLKGIVLKALIYPAILLLVVIGVVIIMMVKIVPQFMASFSQLGMELPAITRAVIAVSNFFVGYWPWLLGSIAGLVVLFQVFKKSTTGAFFLGKLSLNFPLVGKLTLKTACARMTRTISTLIGSGIPIVRTVDIVSRLMGNAVLRKALEEAKIEVERGVSLSKPLEYSGVFPPMVYHMIGIGEETGNMEEMLDKIADYYDEETQMATETLMAALEPMIIILMAVLVLPIILAIMLPMLSVNQMGL